MSNIIKYSNLRPFKSGAEWTGNRSGRPKLHYKRDKYTDEIFEKHKNNGNIDKVADILFDEAITERKPWAITQICNIFFTRPKNDENQDDSANNNDVVEKLKEIPSAKLTAIHKILSEENEDD